MRHSKSQFIADARRVGTGAVGNRTYRVGLNAGRLGSRTYRPLFLDFTIFSCSSNPVEATAGQDAPPTMGISEDIPLRPMNPR